jgi:FkbM family methyltransferase
MRFFRRRVEQPPADGTAGRPFEETNRRLTNLPSEPGSFPGIGERLAHIEAELRQVQLAIDFVRTRTSCYVGDGVALTYLADETPIFVNSNDMGPPFNMMNGGRYEEDNLAVLLSFVKPDSVFLDIGANLGFYTLKIGRRLGRGGVVYAFEPHPKAAELLARNIHVNGLRERVRCFRFGLSDVDGTATLRHPLGHLGGSHIGPAGDSPGHASVAIELKRLDSLLGRDFRCDIVKIDVEGHELNALRGMRDIIANSPDIKILFEKLTPNAGSEAALEAYFAELGFALYGVRSDASLTPLDPGAMAAWGGYILATRPGCLADGLRRNRFSIHGGQLLMPPASTPAPDILRGAADQDGMLFHGPYWYLPRGVWRFRLHGDIRGAARFRVLERFGYPVHEFTLQSGETEHVFVAHRDLVYFETAAYAAGGRAEVTLERLEFIREA